MVGGFQDSNKDTNTHEYFSYDSAFPELCKNNVQYNRANRTIVFVGDDKKVDLRLSELRNCLKINEYLDHIIAKAFHDAKLQGLAPKPKGVSKNIPFVRCLSNTLTMKNIWRKIRNWSSEH